MYGNYLKQKLQTNHRPPNHGCGQRLTQLLQNKVIQRLLLVLHAGDDVSLSQGYPLLHVFVMSSKQNPQEWSKTIESKLSFLSNIRKQHNSNVCFQRNIHGGNLTMDKHPYQPNGRSLEITRGRGVSTAKIFKGNYEAKLDFPRGWGRGLIPRNLPGGLR